MNFKGLFLIAAVPLVPAAFALGWAMKSTPAAAPPPAPQPVLSADQREMAKVVEALLRGYWLIDYPPGEENVLALSNESRSTHEFVPSRSLVRQMADEGYLASESGRRFAPNEPFTWDVVMDWYVTTKGYALYLATRRLE